MKKLLLVISIFVAGVVNAQVQETKPIYYFNPNWSADGKQIVFESTKDGKFAIYTIQTDGTNLRKLTNGEFNDEQPRWSPNGKEVVFISDRDGHLQLYLMNADGSNQRRQTNAPDLDYLPDFSPDGKWVTFMSRKKRTGTIHDIYVIRTDGTERTRLTDEATNEMSPRWSPNGKEILFTRTDSIPKDVEDNFAKMSREERLKAIAKRNSSAEIFVMKKDGSNVHRLTNNDVSDDNPAWSKDGKTIYFVSERDGSRNIYAMKSDGSKVRKIADGSIVTSPNISRDGKSFAYTKEVEKKWGLYIFDIKSGNERLLIGG